MNAANEDDMFLTDAQIERLTKKKQHPAQRRVLIAMGFPFTVRPDGSLALLVSAVEKLMNPGGTRKIKTPQPNWGAVS
jgi:hypothetical protein